MVQSPSNVVSRTGSSSITTRVNPRLVETLRTDESSYFFDAYNSRRAADPRLPRTLDRQKVQEGKLYYKDLTGFETDGLKVLSHTTEPQWQTLSKRKLKGLAAVIGVITSLGSAIYLAYSSVKKILRHFGVGDSETANKSVGNAFLLGSISGMATGLAQENKNWFLGSGGMGILGRFLDKPWGLALFSIFDGLNAIGMGEVSRRDKKNATDTSDSIFNRPNLQAFKF